MILRTTLTSPFGRKARMGALHLGLLDGLTLETADALEENSPLRRDNPLGKIPVLIRDDGACIYDSRVILETFDHMAGGNRLLAAEWDRRLAQLTAQALADGMMDAAVLIVYEGRHRPEELHHAPWLAYQRGKITRGLAALTRSAPDPRQVDVGTIATACMFGYLDWRKQVDWRGDFPILAPWLDAFRAASGLFDGTRGPE